MSEVSNRKDKAEIWKAKSTNQIGNGRSRNNNMAIMHPVIKASKAMVEAMSEAVEGGRSPETSTRHKQRGRRHGP